MSIGSPQPALRSATIPQSYIGPAPTIVHLVEHDCDCAAYEPYVARGSDTLSAATIGKLMAAGIFVGLVIILTIDPAGAMVALRATMGMIS
jgi:hypothetical protein